MRICLLLLMVLMVGCSSADQVPIECERFFWVKMMDEHGNGAGFRYGCSTLTNKHGLSETWVLVDDGDWEYKGFRDVSKFSDMRIVSQETAFVDLRVDRNG